MKRFRAIDTKKAASWAGTVLMLASLVFIVGRLMQMRQDLDFSIFRNPRTLSLLLLLACLEGMFILLAAVNFRNLAGDVSGVAVNRTLAIKVYATSNLYKYIPGGVMYILGRNRMAIETEALRHSRVALATVLEGVLFTIAALILSMAYASDQAIYYFRQLDISPLVGLVPALLLLVALPLLFHFRQHLGAALKNFRESNPGFRPLTLAKRQVFVLLIMNLSPLAFLATLALLGQPMTLSLGIADMGLILLSWLAGFLTPGAPSGLGIREAVLLLFLAGTLDEGILLSAMLTHRILAVAGDVIAYGIALVYVRLKEAGHRKGTDPPP